MIRIGIVGIGFMGRIHFLAAQRLTDARVTAICSRDPVKRAGDWSSTRGNFGPEPGHVDLREVKAYASYDELVADPEIDLVDICTVTDQHAAMAIKALNAGKNVLVEKAIALTLGEADTMLAAAASTKKLLMVAHVLPFFPEFAYAAEAARTGTFGRLRGAHFTRVIARPDWSADIGDAAKTGGPAVDLHIHDTHFIGLIAGVPQRLFSSGVIERGIVSYLTTHYLYDSGPAITCSSGAVAAAGRPFVHGFEMYLERATLAHSSTSLPLTVYHTDGSSEVPMLSGGGDPIEAFAQELQSAAEGVQSGSVPDLLSAKLARDALELCHREIESVRTGAVVSL